MIEVRCDKKWKSFINEKQLQKILKVFLSYLFETDRGISLYVTDDAEIQKLNKQFLKKDSPTDVLSWSYNENVSGIDEKIIFEGERSSLVGELIVSAERIIEQSIENGWDFKTELIRLLAHGCTHLAGWDHESSLDEDREMLEIEIVLLKKVGLEDIY